ncbi:MAG: alpha/beta fold hydrolase [Congregibacter sp.]
MKRKSVACANPALGLLGALVLALATCISLPVFAEDNPGSRIVEGSGGVPLVVQEWGNPDGIPVLMLHGFSFGAVSFKNQIGPIAEKLRFIAPDLRGHGLSAKPWTPEAYAGTEVWAEDIAAVVKAFDLDRPIIVGWSFGGFVAMNYLRHCGADCASGLMLVGSLAGLVPRPPPPDPAKSETPPIKGDARADDYHQLFDGAEWVARVMTYEAPSELDMLQKQLTIVMMPPHVRRAMLGLALQNEDMPAKLTLPTLFIHGEKDFSVPSASIQAAVAALPDAEALAIPSVGHSPFAERPELFNSTLLDFAQSANRH